MDDLHIVLHGENIKGVNMNTEERQDWLKSKTAIKNRLGFIIRYSMSPVKAQKISKKFNLLDDGRFSLINFENYFFCNLHIENNKYVIDFA